MRQFEWITVKLKLISLPNFGQKKSFAEAKDYFLAGAEGLEPPTPGFGDRCSTN